MNVIATQTPSVEDFLAGGKNDRAEFVRGERIEKALPSGPHSDAQALIVSSMLNYCQKTGRGKARPEWHHRFGPPDDRRIYVPDIAFVLAPRHTNLPEYADSASDIMIEIVSPNANPADLVDKVEFYLQNGARSVWVVDPQKKRMYIYRPGQAARQIAAGGTLTDDLLPGFQLSLAELFA